MFSIVAALIAAVGQFVTVERRFAVVVFVHRRYLQYVAVIVADICLSY